MSYLSGYYNFLKRISHWTSWTVSFVLLVGVFLVINSDYMGTGYVRQVSDGVEVLDSYFYYPPQMVPEVLSSLGEAGRNAYLNVNLLDFLFPMIYTIFFCISMSMTYTFIYPAESKRNWLLLLPFVTLIADYGENISIRLCLMNFPNQLPGAAQAASFFTPIKFTFLVVVSLLILQGNMKVTNILFSKKSK